MQHTNNEIVRVAVTLLQKLLESSQLDLETEANDCLQVFNDYDWKRNHNSDEAAFNTLLDAGRENRLSITELNEFMDLVSTEGEHHLYKIIRDGWNLIVDYHKTRILSN